jgi:hypothetical protein
MPPEYPYLDSLLALSWAAAHTTRLLLGTGIVVLPHHNPVVFAKQAASTWCGSAATDGRLRRGSEPVDVPPRDAVSPSD